MIGFEVDGANKMADLLYELGANSDKAISIALLRCAQFAEGQIKRTIKKVFKPGTGNLMRSFKAQMLTESGDVISAGAISDLVYAGIQDQGGIIYPKSVNNLAVPTDDVPLGKWPRDYPKDAFDFAPSLFGNPDRTGWLISKDTDEVMFTLMKKVEITGEDYIADAKAISDPEYPRIINEELIELLEKSKKKADK
jgi:hypothetical protein